MRRNYSSTASNTPLLSHSSSAIIAPSTNSNNNNNQQNLSNSLSLSSPSPSPEPQRLSSNPLSQFAIAKYPTDSPASASGLEDSYGINKTSIPRSSTIAATTSATPSNYTPKVPRGDRKAIKSGTLEEATAAFQLTDDDVEGMAGFDPRKWIIAAGILEKRRDGAFRDGWAKRWFILDGDTLYYFLLPKDDIRGMCRLLGEERGQIKMCDVDAVRSEEDHWVIHMTMRQIKKSTVLSMNSSSTEIRLRASSKEAGKMWYDALLKASIAAKRRSHAIKHISTKLSEGSNRRASTGTISKLNHQNSLGERISDLSGNSPFDQRMNKNNGEGNDDNNNNNNNNVNGNGDPSQTTESANKIDDARNRPMLQRTTSISSTSSNILKVTNAQISKLTPKFAPAKHIRSHQAAAIMAILNSFCYSSFSLNDTLMWIVANFLVIIALVLFERQALLHDSIVSIANRTIKDLQEEILTTGVNPSGTLARRASSAKISKTFSSSYSSESSTRQINKGLATSTSSVSELESPVESGSSTLPSPIKPNTSSDSIEFGDFVVASSSTPPTNSKNNIHGWTAGTNMKKIENDNSSPNASMSWFDPRGDRFKLRIGPNYKVNGKKGPSADPLYELVAMDILRSNNTIFHIASHVNLPQPRPGADDMQAIKKSGFPRLFIVNAQIPEKAPSLWGSNPDDSGVSVVFYFAIKPETVQAMNSNQTTPAIRLLHRFVTQDNDDIRRRFKGIGFADNITELGIPGAGMVEKFNGEFYSILILFHLLQIVMMIMCEINNNDEHFINGL